MDTSPRSESRPSKGSRQPIDFGSRGVRLRLFLGLAVVMLGLSLIERAADPEFRRWLTGTAPPTPATGNGSPLSGQTWRTAGDPPGTFVSTLVSNHEVRDDTPVFRPAEQADWFATIAQVQQKADQPAVRVSYLQLYNQPAEYRGKHVAVRGTVRLAYRVPALANELGIEHYYVYWIHPAGGPDSPILVYALEAPPGFPLADGPPQVGKPIPKMHEDVEVSGVFFKRAAYAGQTGTYTAPLIVAARPTWTPATEAPPKLPLSAVELAIIALVALVLAVCLTAVVWKRSRRPRTSATSVRPPDLGSLVLGPTASENLRELERHAQNEENA